MRPIDADALAEKILNVVRYVIPESEFTEGYTSGLYAVAKGIQDEPTIEQLKWIPVTERLPTDEGMYRVCHKSKAIADRYFYGDGELFIKFGNDPVTHWKPIEEPPKGG